MNKTRPKKLLIALSVVCASVVLAGCASDTRVLQAEVVVQPMPDFLSQSGYEQVAWVKMGKQTVAFRFDGYRHVITPDMNNGWYNPNLGEDHSRLFTPVKGTAPAPVETRVTVSQLPPYASTPEEMAAWKAWCAGEEITEAQFELVVGTRLPPDAPFPCDDFHRTVWQK